MADHVFITDVKVRSRAWLDGLLGRFAEGRGDPPLTAIEYDRAVASQVIDAFAGLEPGDRLRLVLGVDENHEVIGVAREDAEAAAEGLLAALERRQRRLAGVEAIWTTIEPAAEDEDGDPFFGQEDEELLDSDDDEEDADTADEDNADDEQHAEDAVVVVLHISRLAHRPEQDEDEDDDLDEDDEDEDDEDEDEDEDEDDEEAA